MYIYAHIHTYMEHRYVCIMYICVHTCIYVCNKHACLYIYVIYIADAYFPEYAVPLFEGHLKVTG